MTKQVDTEKYVEFVKEVTSAPSLDWTCSFFPPDWT